MYALYCGIWQCSIKLLVLMLLMLEQRLLGICLQLGVCPHTSYHTHTESCESHIPILGQYVVAVQTTDIHSSADWTRNLLILPYKRGGHDHCRVSFLPYSQYRSSTKSHSLCEYQVVLASNKLSTNAMCACKTAVLIKCLERPNFKFQARMLNVSYSP